MTKACTHYKPMAPMATNIIENFFLSGTLLNLVNNLLILIICIVNL